MPEGFLSSEEYDEQAHRLYHEGDYDEALQLLKEGLTLYPHAVELYVGLGYARLAREEFAWARRAFEEAVALDGAHEDALVGLGECLLRFGESERAVRIFDEVAAGGGDGDVELILTMGRALYREGLYALSRDMFARAVSVRPDDAEGVASVGYALHRLGDEVGASRQIRRALRLDPDFTEARVYLAHVLFDRGDWENSLREFERVPPQDHWDSLAVWRLIELKRALWDLEAGDAGLIPWETRLRELEDVLDPLDRLLADVESGGGEGGDSFGERSQLELFGEGRPHPGQEGRWTVRLLDGHRFRGSMSEIVRLMRDHAGFAHESVTQYMRRLAERWHEQTSVEVPFLDPETFLRAAAAAGLLYLEADDGEIPT